jgi:hypothetical protein
MTITEYLITDPIIETDKNHILYRHYRHLFISPQFHSYYENFYDSHLSDYFSRDGMRICEIGINRGASLYLLGKVFPTSTILGIDIDVSIVAERYKDVNNCLWLNTDAYNPLIANILGSFDIIIDDGPHSAQSQIDFVKLYSGNVAPGGTMIIEDVQSLDIAEELLRITPAGFTSGIVDLREKDDRYDSLIIHMSRL